MKDKVQINQFPFHKDTISQLKNHNYGKNWPVVYILNNEKMLYVGETSNAQSRMNQHLKDHKRKSFKNIRFIYNEKFNKSAILDIESLLISYLNGDGVYKLQNGNAGTSRNHNYYQREVYRQMFDVIWCELKQQGLVQSDLKVIENSQLFKYSPYKTLNDDQYHVMIEILTKILTNENGCKFIVHGGAGTGKSILAIFLMKLLCDAKNYESKDNYTILEAVTNISSFNYQNIALVVPQTSLRNTLKNVFKNIDGLRASMVIGPSEVMKKDYDILIVDEAHRLKQRRNITNFKSHDDINKKLNLGKDGTELDWILTRSKFQILFYDQNQSIKGSDITSKSFQDKIENGITFDYYLKQQMRVQAGVSYSIMLKDIFDTTKTPSKQSFNEYEFILYDDVETMRKKIIEKNNEFGLSRMVAGYAWQWSTKGKSYNEIIEEGLFDIEIENYHYIWNTVDKDWVNSTHAIDEVGCVHTVQGYDLNYAGVIIGPELSYDKKNNQIVFNKALFKDKKVLNGSSEKELQDYILNTYYVLLSRGIKGTYVYACDKSLQEYLSLWIKKEQE